MNIWNFHYYYYDLLFCVHVWYRIDVWTLLLICSMPHWAKPKPRLEWGLWGPQRPSCWPDWLSRGDGRTTERPRENHTTGPTLLPVPMSRFIYFFHSFFKTIISSITIHNNPTFDPLPKKTFERNLKLTCHGICIGLLGKICKIFRSGAEGSEAERWLLCHGSHQSRGNGGREHHLCRCHSGFDPKRRIWGCETAQRSLDWEEQWNWVWYHDTH